MTISIVEQRDSRSGSGSGDLNSSQTRIYWSSGSDDIEAVLKALQDAEPVTITCPVLSTPLYRNSISYKPRGVSKFELTVEYIDKDQSQIRSARSQEVADTNLDIGEYRVSFSTMGGTAHITTSLATMAQYKASTNPNAIPSYKQAIRVDKDGVQGCDVVVPQCKFSIHYRQPRSIITDAYQRTLENMTGTVNESEFKGRPAGEVLFLGANGSQGTKSDPVVEYEFVRLPNLQDQVIGDITGVAKRGHDYLWVQFEDTYDSAAKVIKKVPKFVYVEQVYPYSDFSALGI
jgi:hypothetical protein